MVETKERKRIYTTKPDSGPGSALAILFSLLIIAVMGFIVYFLSAVEIANRPSVIEPRGQEISPIPVPAPVTPVPNIESPAINQSTSNSPVR
jgi:hypothetical protein